MKAYEILEAGFCVKHFAEDKDGNPVPVQSSDAVKFCLYGAVMRKHGREFSGELTNAYFEDNRKLIRAIQATNCVTVSDYAFTHTKEECVALLKELDL